MFSAPALWPGAPARSSPSNASHTGEWGWRKVVPPWVNSLPALLALLGLIDSPVEVQSTHRDGMPQSCLPSLVLRLKA